MNNEMVMKKKSQNSVSNESQEANNPLDEKKPQGVYAK